MIKITGRSVRTLLLAGLLALSTSGFAQDYPTKPIRLLIPAPPGGGTDILARVMADHLGKQFGQPIVFDHKGGASGMIAVENLMQAPADGYTLLMVYSGIVTVNQSLHKNIKYDPLKDLVGIANFAEVPNLLIVHPSFKVESIKDLIAQAKAKPDGITYASSGNGVSNHLAMELFKQMAGVSIVHVPYKGGSAAMIDLLGSRIEAYYSTPSSAASHIQSKKLIALATTGLTRSEGLASLPTIAESGYPEFNATNWYAYVAPAKTPTAILDRWNTEFVKVLTTPSVRDALLAMGLIPDPMTRQGLADYMAKESATWKAVIQERNIKIE